MWFLNYFSSASRGKRVEAQEAGNIAREQQEAASAERIQKRTDILTEKILSNNPAEEFRQEVVSKVIYILIEQLGLDDNEAYNNALVDVNSHIIADLDADSLDSVELAMAFEDTYKMEIPDSDIGDAKIKTVWDLIKYIHSRVV